MDYENDMDGLAQDLSAIGKGQAFMSKFRQKRGMSPHVMPLKESRAVYEYLRTVYPKEVLVTEGFLRSVIKLPFATPVQTLNFILNKNDQTAPALAIENRLDQSDTFETTGFRFGWFTLACDALGNITGLISRALFQYYPNPLVYTVANEAANMQAAYNGYLYVKIGDTVYFEQYPAENFLNVSVSQQAVAVSAVPTAGIIQRNSGAYKDFTAPVTPIIQIDGSGKNVFQIQLPESVDLSAGAIGVATRANYVFFECRGYKCQNGAKQKTLKFKI